MQGGWGLRKSQACTRSRAQSSPAYEIIEILHHQDSRAPAPLSHLGLDLITPRALQPVE